MERIAKALTCFDHALERYFSKKWHWLITVPAVVLLLTGLYFLFCFSTSRYATTGYCSEEWRKAGHIVGAIIIVHSLAYIFLEIYLRLATGRKVVWGFMVIASTFLVLWAFNAALDLSPYHHDAGAMGNGNHWSIIYDIYSTGRIPPVNKYNQYYQPKLYHTIIAGLMKFNSLFIHIGDEPLSDKYPAYTLSAYQSLELTRVFMICLGIASFYAIYRIYRGLGLSDKKVAVCTAITILLPEFWYIQFFMNNDGLALTLSLMALALALEFRKKENIIPLLFSALCLGLAMMAKINAALMAIPMAAIFAITFFKKFAETEEKGKKIGFLLLKFGAFALIVFPLGLWVPIFYKVQYGLPIGYVMDLCPTLEQKKNYGMYIDPEFYNFFQRCIAFPSEDFFFSPFNFRWRSRVNGVYVNEYGKIDFNCWTAFFKTGFFDEWSSFFDKQGYIAGALLVLGLYVEVLLVFVAIFVGIWYVFRFFYKKQFRLDPTKQIVLVVTAITYVINYIYFVNKYPVGCSQNARYLMPFFLPLQALVGSMLCDAQSFLSGRSKKREDTVKAE
ncbi:MAG: glycosyltransferase family 39 protein [Bacilli bacterium]|nr:glycosyltransferase family 39 protein [Bacilli bacterium]